MLIFAIDDEPLLLDETKASIAEAAPEAEILPFHLAADALDAVERQGLSPDIVFCDIEMPGISGLEFAVRLKNLSPETRVVFVTGYSQYALDAFRVRAQGYIMKPLTPEQIKTELSALPARPAPSPEPEKLTVRCLGDFEVFWRGEPLLFGRRQTKELFAYLIDRRGALCTAEEVASAMWEDDDMQAAKTRLRSLIYDLRKTLASIGMSALLIRRRGQIGIRTDMVDCDYYRMLKGDMEAVNAYYGEYMRQYSWAELTGGSLYFGSF